MDCPFINRCPMFPQFRNEFGLQVFKTAFCKSEWHTNCERYKQAITGTMPPANLLPNGKVLSTDEDDRDQGPED
mgnify:CR=1 FL=1